MAPPPPRAADAPASPSSSASPPGAAADADDATPMALEARGVRTADDGPTVSVRVGRGELVGLAAADGDPAPLLAFAEAVVAGTEVVAGTILVGGVEVGAAGRSRVGDALVLGGLELPPRATPTSLLALYATAGLGEAVEATGLTADAETPVDELGAGARRRLEVARALVSEAALLTGEDPRPALHEDDARAFDAALVGAAERGLAILLVVPSPDADLPGGGRLLVVGGETADEDASPAPASPPASGATDEAEADDDGSSADADGDRDADDDDRDPADDDPTGDDADAQGPDALDAQAPGADAPAEPGSPTQRALLLELALRGLDREEAADELRDRTGATPDPAVLADVFGRLETPDEGAVER